MTIIEAVFVGIGALTVVGTVATLICACIAGARKGEPRP